ncbi:MAG: hypothetical protein D6816_10685 [Bacteroidetes bacterium]|nr:MAG: hypothetical protein D6816_10685 [Bacteroidota bacterium]
MTPEGKVKEEVKKILKEFGDDVWWFMPVPTGYGTRGVPDFIVCLRGTFVAIETKSGPGKKPSAFQTKQINAIHRAGGHAVVTHCDNLDALRSILRGLHSEAS